MLLRKTHLWVAALGLLVFVLQGQYMDHVHDHLVNMDDAPRMLYRSSHIYLLLVSVINSVMGVHLRYDGSRLQRLSLGIISGIVLLAPIFLLIGFFVEPGLDRLARPFTRPALYGLFGTGVVLSLYGAVALWHRDR